MITDFKDLDLSRQYSYQDYLSWKFKERVELFRGWVQKMSPAPSRRHQEISGTLFFEIKKVLNPVSSCKVYTAPFDVRLPVVSSEGKSDTVVQPDITVVCDPAKLDERGCNGAPDMVIEILSPGNTKKEMKDKLHLYEQSGVPEYWVVDPEHHLVFVYLLKEDRYVAFLPITEADDLASIVLPKLKIDVAQLFAED